MIALLCLVLAGLMTAAEAALQSFSKARADRLVKGGVRGAERVLRIMEDPAPTLNTAMFVRVVLEVAAIVLVATSCSPSSPLPGSSWCTRRW